MNLKLEIELAKRKVDEEFLARELLVNYLADRRIYHIIAVVIFSEVFNEDDNISRNFVDDNEFYHQFKFDENPFNEDFINE